jgi:HK97 family phage prohead protease
MDKSKRRNPERRYLTQPIEIRKKGESPALVGYAARFNSLSEDLGGFREVIAPGAFSGSLADASIEVKALFNHDPNLVLGSTSARTLALSEDENGLHVEIVPPDTTTGRDVAALVARGDVNKMSFGFRTILDNWKVESGQVVRTLLDVQVFDVSPVTYPAYPETEIGVRDLLSAREDIPAEVRAALGLDAATPIVETTEILNPVTDDDYRYREIRIAEAA